MAAENICNLLDFRFYLITDRKLCGERGLLEVVRQACEAGVSAIQIREKDLDEDNLLELVAALSAIAELFQAKLFLNLGNNISSDNCFELLDKKQIQGLHVPEHCSFPEKLCTEFPKMLLGISTHSIESANKAQQQGADFVTFGPVFATPSKSRFGPPQGLDALKQVVDAIDIPVIALGGITPENTNRCVSAGAYGVSVISSVMKSNNVATTVKGFKKRLPDL